MASGRCSAALVLFVSLAMLAVQQTAEARSIIRGVPTASTAAAVVGSSSAGSTNAFSHRRMLAAPVAVARMAKVSSRETADQTHVLLHEGHAAPCSPAGKQLNSF